VPAKDQLKPPPKVKAPIEEHKKHADEFLAREEYKKPKDGELAVSDEAKP
jgi:hypothetical protein